MWSDNASKIDMLSYLPYAKLIYDISIDERMNPLTIGLFGSWGSGKSTLLNLINETIENQKNEGIVSIKVNAWMFEGYDDAKTALMDSILKAINDNTKVSQSIKREINSLIKKVDWIRIGKNLAKKGIPLVTSMISGNFVPAIISSVNSVKNIDILNEENINGIKDFFKNENDDEKDLIENIRTFRKEFEDLIGDEKSKIKHLIIMIDDLDRCTPERILETLEAIKLFLSVKKTTFIIAVDEEVVRYSIKRKYPQLAQGEEIDISKDYIEKIIQLPIKLPELSDIDIKNYLLLLICEMYLKKDELDNLLKKLLEKGFFIKGEIISYTDIRDLLKDINPNIENLVKTEYELNEFKKQLEIFSKVGNIIASNLKGNPRQAKRFLNTFYVRKKLSDIQSLNLDLAILAKLMVLEYIDLNLFKQLYKWQFQNKGLSEELKEIEDAILNNTEIDNKFSAWNKEYIKSWICVEPNNLSNYDLRQYFYLARESVKEKNLSMLDLGLEVRKRINEICNTEIDSSTRRKKIEELKQYNSNEKDEIIKGIISKYNQNRSKYIETLIWIYEIFEEYRDKIICELKKVSKNDMNLPNIALVERINKYNSQHYKELKNYYLQEKITKENLWHSIGGK